MPSTVASGGGLNDCVDTVAAQPDGKVVVGGYFTAVNSAGPSMIARLNKDGSLDADFVNHVRVTGDPPTGQGFVVGSVAVQPDGKILIGGLFKSVNGMSRPGLARLNPDGTLDNDFLNGLEGPSPCPWYAQLRVAVQADGKILIGGDFETVNGVSRPGLARLNPDGSPDTGFLNGLSGPNADATHVAVQPDGKVVIIGNFASVNGAPAWAIARLHGSTGQLYPSLSIRGTGTHVVLTWPLGFSDYTLQSTDSAAPRDWQPVAVPIEAVGGQFQVSLLPTNHAQFFRLWKP